jgi:transposase
MEGMVTLSSKEQNRLGVIGKLEQGELVGRQASALLGISLRQMRRLLAGYRKKGLLALAHGNRGRTPANATSASLKDRVISLANGRYIGFNQQHFTEMLAEQEGIFLSRSSVRSILLKSGIKSPKVRRPPRHRSRRERYPQEGMLLQIDASPHDWLEGRGPIMSLLGAIDDATGKVVGAIFRLQEDTAGYFMLIRSICERYGIPLAIYRDRHSIFELPPDKLPSLEEQLEGKIPLTQFGRLMQELEVSTMAARSPQAKGRVERLWGTFQDRLVSEMRLSQVSTLIEANRFLGSFLERYNSRFALSASADGLAYRKASSRQLEMAFCLKHCRTVGLDNVVHFNGQRLQILPSSHRLSYARCKVEVHQQLDGAIKLYYQGEYLDTSPAPLEASGARKLAANTIPYKTDKVFRPAADHPWKRRLLAIKG